MKYYALHGFLGRPSDWDENVSAIDLFNEPILPFWQWAQTFNKKISQDGSQHRTLIGYSMGGRLALHALIDKPHLWGKVILISTHPGLSSFDLKQQRLLSDKIWAEKFLSQPWDQLIDDWNSQPIFQNEVSPFQRNEADFNRQVLAKALSVWSLGYQDDLTAYLANISTPTVWITGSKDQVYSNLASQVSLLMPNGSHRVIVDAGHRIQGAPPLWNEF